MSFADSRRRPYRRRKTLLNRVFDNLPLTIVFVVLALLVFGAIGCSTYAKTSEVTLTITDKESVTTADGNEYRVYTTTGTYKIGDSIVHPRFNSADLYGRLQKGTYKCEVYGWRVPLLSMFENILRCEKARPSEGLPR